MALRGIAISAKPGTGSFDDRKNCVPLKHSSNRQSCNDRKDSRTFAERAQRQNESLTLPPYVALHDLVL